jgi:hypothetical protein
VRSKKRVTPEDIKALAKEVISKVADPEIVALNLMYAFYQQDIEGYIKMLSLVTNDNSNAVARSMSYINDYLIYASLGIKRKFWSNHWDKVNKLAAIFKKQSSEKFLKRVAIAQVDLVELATAYPLVPMKLVSVFKG